jgi:hypothetical protein
LLIRLPSLIPSKLKRAAGTVFPVVFRLGVSNCRNEIVVGLASFIAAKSFVWAGVNRDREVEEAGRLFWHHVDDLLRPVIDPLLFLVGELLFSPAPILYVVVCTICAGLLLKSGCASPGTDWLPDVKWGGGLLDWWRRKWHPV